MSFAVAMQDVSFGYEAHAPIMRVKDLYIVSGRQGFLHGASRSDKSNLSDVIAGVLHPRHESCEVLVKDRAQLEKCINLPLPVFIRLQHG